MDDKDDLMKFRAAPLTANNFSARLNDMKLILKVKKLWPSVAGTACDQVGPVNKHKNQDDEMVDDSEVQKRAPALANIICTVEISL